jgi:hypothetical protein
MAPGRTSNTALNKVRQGDKTHCPQNHEYSEENTYRTPEGFRRCRACDARKQYLRRLMAKIAKDEYGVGDGRPRKPRTGPTNYVRGEQVHTAKLTPAQIATIRERYADGGVLQRDLGAEFGVSQAQISAIVRGKSWSAAS